MKRIIALILALVLINPLWGHPVSAATDILTHPTLPTNLVSYYSLEETSGTRDDADGTNDLTDNNTVLSGTGKQSTAADFEEATDEYLSKTDPTAWDLDISGDMSAAGWVNFETAMGSGAQVFFLGRDSGAPNRNWYYGFLDSGGVDGVSMYNSSDGTNGGTTSWIRVAYTPGFTVSTWYCVAWVYTASAGSLQAYVNGSGIGTTTGLNGSMYTGGTARVVLGQYSPNVAAGLGFDGLADEVGVWNKALSSSEVYDYCNGGAGLPYSAAGGGGAAAVLENFIWFD